jgi:hypothetical protein
MARRGHKHNNISNEEESVYSTVLHQSIRIPSCQRGGGDGCIRSFIHFFRQIELNPSFALVPPATLYMVRCCFMHNYPPKKRMAAERQICRWREPADGVYCMFWAAFKSMSRGWRLSSVLWLCVCEFFVAMAMLLFPPMYGGGPIHTFCIHLYTIGQNGSFSGSVFSHRQSPFSIRFRFGMEWVAEAVAVGFCCWLLERPVPAYYVK